MALTINDNAPDFEANTTEGPIRFHEWLGDGWGVLFSHPKDFTPVCTTELGRMAALKPEFEKRGVKIIGLSVDPVENHKKWSIDIAETQGTAPNYPMIGDTDLKVAKLYGMLPADTAGTSEGRTPADNATVRAVFVVGPDKKIKLALIYPMKHGAQLRRDTAHDRLASAHRKAQGGDAGRLEAGRRRHHPGLRLRRGRKEEVSRRMEVAAALHAHRAAAELKIQGSPASDCASLPVVRQQRPTGGKP